MDYACDVYVYSDVNGGYTCHVAGSRHVGDTPIPKIPHEWWKAPTQDLMDAMAKQREWLDRAKQVDIGLPYDGESYYSQDRDTMVDTLKMLKAAGYTMPDDLIETIASEEDDV